MKKRSVLFVFLIAIIISTTMNGFANPKKEDSKKDEAKSISVKDVEDIAETINVEKGFINKPKDFILNTVNDALVVSGKGRENDRVTITLYKRDGDSYVQMGKSVELKIGPLGVFTKELSLKDTSQKSPKEAVVSKDTFIVLELKRGESTTWDYRLVRFSDDKEVKKSLEASKLTPAKTK